MVTYGVQLIYLLLILGYNFLILFLLLKNSGKQLTLISRAYPTDIYLLKVNNKNSTARCETCSKLTRKTLERRHGKCPLGISGRIRGQEAMNAIFSKRAKIHKKYMKLGNFSSFLKRALSCMRLCPDIIHVSKFSYCYTIS